MNLHILNPAWKVAFKGIQYLLHDRLAKGAGIGNNCTSQLAEAQAVMQVHLGHADMICTYHFILERFDYAAFVLERTNIGNFNNDLNHGYNHG